MNYRLLQEGEVIQEGDEYLTVHFGRPLWNEVSWVSIGENVDFERMVRRPITLSWLRKEMKRLMNREKQEYEI